MPDIDPGRAQAALDAVALEVPLDSPGIVMGVVTGDGLVASHASGLASVEHLVPASESTRFYVASLSKQFTAACVLLASDAGALDLGSRLSDWVPELPAWASRVEVTHLLAHSSGLPEYLELVQVSGRSQDDELSEELILGLLSQVPALTFAPGSQFVYCNTGYWFLGVVLHRAKGTRLRAFADQHLFKPVGMLDSQYRDDRWEVLPGLADGYAPRDPGGVLPILLHRWGAEGSDVAAASAGRSTPIR